MHDTYMYDPNSKNNYDNDTEKRLSTENNRQILAKFYLSSPINRHALERCVRMVTRLVLINPYHFIN